MDQQVCQVETPHGGFLLQKMETSQHAISYQVGGFPLFEVEIHQHAISYQVGGFHFLR